MSIGFFVNLEDAMDYGDVTVFDFENDNVSNVDFLDGIVEEEYVASLEGGFHGSREDYYYWRFGLACVYGLIV
jgi:hypothetical protein